MMVYFFTPRKEVVGKQTRQSTPLYIIKIPVLPSLEASQDYLCTVSMKAKFSTSTKLDPHYPVPHYPCKSESVFQLGLHL